MPADHVPAPPRIDRNDDILNPSYRLLSSVPRVATAQLMPRYYEPASAGRGADAPGPGKYHRPGQWGDAIGTRMRPHQASRDGSTSPRGSSRPSPRRLDVPYYDVQKSWKTPSGSMTFRHSDRAAERSAARPGPGVYNPNNNTVNARTDAHDDTKRCTFGAPHKPERVGTNPGPGAYPQTKEVGTPSRDSKGAVMARRAGHPELKLSALVPGPGSYTLPGAFTQRQGQLDVTFKKRLPHPMDDHLAMHEAAKTSVARAPELRMRARPHLSRKR
jgi:hypothetical protein